jgi:hypothetical protein
MVLISVDHYLLPVPLALPVRYSSQLALVPPQLGALDPVPPQRQI